MLRIKFWFWLFGTADSLLSFECEGHPNKLGVENTSVEIIECLIISPFVTLCSVNNRGLAMLLQRQLDLERRHTSTLYLLS